jgi:hypothetical protein
MCVKNESAHSFERVVNFRFGRDVPMTRAVFEELMAYRSAFGVASVPGAGEEYGLLLSTKTRPVAIGSELVTEVKPRRYFRAWASLTSRKIISGAKTGSP